MREGETKEEKNGVTNEISFRPGVVERCSVEVGDHRPTVDGAVRAGVVCGVG